MANENFFGRIPTETLAIKFTGKNYATWEFQFRMFLKGKELWGHIDGSLMAPENAKDLGQWETKDARIISWLLGSIEAHMVNNIRPLNTAKEMWDYLKRIYHQDNTARRFQLELEIGNLSQGDISIEQYYSGFLNLWGEYSNIIYSKVPKEALANIQAIHEVSKRDQFLMKLRSDFDVARAGLLNRNPVPSLDICLGELLHEEQRLATQAVLGASLEKSTVINVAYAAQGRNRAQPHTCCLLSSLIGAQIHLKLWFLSFQGSLQSTSLAFCFHKLSLLIQLKYPISQPLSISSAPQNGIAHNAFHPTSQKQPVNSDKQI
ncbi:hypothetical protein ZIOFF_000701 [Zingiber officinale]|uniref:Retrotransposon Copia-like N-terminal domain-containing protein n=1 Tax=Zingiber officinale TaxID=94328 RepID=A0A8J5I4V7_ZINOF|nr:hypothetical protein ZIOFF_000701 [Zingiber officinale]